ncbi:MAG: DUF368 domain-containing protein [Gammaproteobacteria bacterium]|nr:DUF368 domain-containing protein [Gammaproteobacteria bacterium]
MKDRVLIVAKGFCMGAADVVPGVSGGTMAFILGIYQRLMEAIRAFDIQLLRLLWAGQVRSAIRHVDLGFLILLVTGIFGALMFFTRVVPLPQLIHTHPELIYGLFFGLIIGSIIILLGEVKNLQAGDYSTVVLGALCGLVLANLVPMETPIAAWFIFFSGALAISAMILPGVSGSFILLILRKYAYIFDAIGHFNLAVILPFALGAATGLMLFSRLLVWLMHHYHRQTMLFITGILFGSLWLIWPFQERVYETVRGKERLVSSFPTLPAELGGSVLASIALCILGLVLVLALQRFSSKQPEGQQAEGRR